MNDDRKNITPIHPVGASFFVTCALKGAIPEIKLHELERKFHLQEVITNPNQDQNQIDHQKNLDRSKFIHEIDNLLHENSGPTFLDSPEIARILLARIESFHMRYYKLLALTIMPNHFHMLIDTSIQIKEIYEPNTIPKNYVQLDQVINLIKDGTARYINHYCKTEGQEVWENESYDVYIRNEKMLDNVVKYILDNPIKAGLVRSYKDHPFTFVIEK